MTMISQEDNNTKGTQTYKKRNNKSNLTATSTPLGSRTSNYKGKSSLFSKTFENDSPLSEFNEFEEMMKIIETTFKTDYPDSYVV